MKYPLRSTFSMVALFLGAAGGHAVTLEVVHPAARSATAHPGPAAKPVATGSAPEAPAPPEFRADGFPPLPAKGPPDQWGLTNQDWLLLQGPDIRQRAGLPGTFDKLLAAANAGDVKAQGIVASAYATGSGVPQNMDEAFNWSKKAADGGLPMGEYQRALNYLLGQGTSPDMAMALKYLKLALSHGYRNTATVIASTFPSSDASNDIYLWINARERLQNALTDGMSTTAKADEILEAYQENKELADLMSDISGIGMSGKNGLFGGDHLQYVTELTACDVLVASRNGMIYSINWNRINTVTNEGDDTLMVLRGFILLNNAFYIPYNTNVQGIASMRFTSFAYQNPELQQKTTEKLLQIKKRVRSIVTECALLRS